MPADEQRVRMRSMRRRVQEYNVYRGAGSMLLDAARLRQRHRVSQRIVEHQRESRLRPLEVKHYARRKLCETLPNDARAVNGRACAHPRICPAARRLLAFDIDGTLAPIVSLPRDARIPDRSQRLLAELAQHNTVAVITGRGVGDAQRMVKFKPRYLVGSHGAEGVPGFEAAGQSYARTCALWTQALHAEDEAWRTIPGVTLEEKTYSLAFHYRHAEDHDAARRILESRILHLSPWPRMIAGKCVLNFVPRDAPHTGDAFARTVLAHFRLFARRVCRR